MANNMRTSLLGAGQVISKRDNTSDTSGASGKPEASVPDDTADQTSTSAHEQAQGQAHQKMVNALRFLAVDAVEKAASGHIGMALGAADIITTLWTKFVRFDPHNPEWIDRDRFILSAGHGSALLYSLLYLIGTEGVTIEDLQNFRQLNSRTPGHPERNCLPGVEVTTGPLGQGFSMAVGMAVAERKLNQQYSDDIIEHYTYVLASDGDLMEGVSAEAAALAGNLKLHRLIVLYDKNDVSIDGATSLADNSNIPMRFQSFQWNVIETDGHDSQSIEAALREAQKSDKPTLIICQTKIGFGTPDREGTAAAHGGPFGEKEIAATRENLQWHNPPFALPDDVLDDWRIAGLTMAKKRGAWQQKWDTLDENTKAELSRRFDKELPDGLGRALNTCKRKLAKEKSLATRKASQAALEVLSEYLPELIGGSADLSDSNGTKAAAQTIFNSQDYSGSYIHYGVREHAMAAAINGMAAHGAILPYGGTFLIFSDYCKPALRLAALMEMRAIFVFTHDSIGLGEDGPTHQPVEHLASLRALPNFNVFRPADGVETIECWEIALAQKNRPSALLLTRQSVPLLRNAVSEENRSRRGAYELRGVDGNEDVTILASGSEVALALEVRRRLNNQRIAARVVSVPCFDLFARQTPEARAQVLGTTGIHVIIEAAANSNWHDIVGDGCHFIGMNSFGASAPAEQLFEKFGFNETLIADKIDALVQQFKQKQKREEF